jgi:DNA-binding LytR/AlgR family response regulator
VANEDFTQLEQLDTQTQQPPSTPLHVVVATEQEELTWSVLNAFGALPEVRVTGCRSMAQTRYVCALDPPQVVIVDMDILANDPLGLVTLANTGREHTHIVALSEHPVFEVGARFGRARLTFIQKPVSSEDLVLLLRLRLDDEPSLPAHVC